MLIKTKDVCLTYSGALLWKPLRRNHHAISSRSSLNLEANFPFHLIFVGKKHRPDKQTSLQLRHILPRQTSRRLHIFLFSHNHSHPPMATIVRKIRKLSRKQRQPPTTQLSASNILSNDQHPIDLAALRIACRCFAYRHGASRVGLSNRTDAYDEALKDYEDWLTRIITSHFTEFEGPPGIGKDDPVPFSNGVLFDLEERMGPKDNWTREESVHWLEDFVETQRLLMALVAQTGI